MFYNDAGRNVDSYERRTISFAESRDLEPAALCYVTSRVAIIKAVLPNLYNFILHYAPFHSALGYLHRGLSTHMTSNQQVVVLFHCLTTII